MKVESSDHFSALDTSSLLHFQSNKLSVLTFWVSTASKHIFPVLAPSFSLLPERVQRSDLATRCSFTCWNLSIQQWKMSPHQPCWLFKLVCGRRHSHHSSSFHYDPVYSPAWLCFPLRMLASWTISESMTFFLSLFFLELSAHIWMKFSLTWSQR